MRPALRVFGGRAVVEWLVQYGKWSVIIGGIDFVVGFCAAAVAAARGNHRRKKTYARLCGAGAATAIVGALVGGGAVVLDLMFGIGG